MPTNAIGRPCRRGLFVSVLQFLASACLLALAACSASGHPRTCDESQDSVCGNGAYCVAGACVNGLLPEAELVLPAESSLVTYTPLIFSARASDPNGKSIRTYAWAVAPDKASCEPHVEQLDTSQPDLKVLFKCAGRYDLKLTVTDAIALSRSVSTSVTVAPSDAPPSIEPLADLAVGHRCASRAGTPGLVCAAGDELDRGITVSVMARDAGGSTALAYAWSWDPPEGVDRNAVRVAFSPQENTNSPTVHIETDGKRIAGAYTFHVHASDARGRTNVADLKVTVGNAPPQVVVTTPSPVAVNHAYTAASATFSAVAALSATVSDPDGDPIDPATAAATIVEEAATGCAITGQAAFSAATGVLTGTATLAASPDLKGPFLGASRKVQLAIADVNGAVGKGETALVVRNRPPVMRTASGETDTASVRVDHAHGPCGSGACFTASGSSPYLATDPDGDPVTDTVTPVVRPTGLLVQTSPGSTRFSLQTADPALLRSAAGASPVTFRHTAADPWGATANESQFTVEVTDRPPTAVAAVTSSTVATRYDAKAGEYVAEAVLGRFADPEGDPMMVEGGTHGACRTDLLADGTLKVRCALPYGYATATAPPELSTLLGAHPLQFVVRDAWNGAPLAAATVTVGDGQPVRNDGGSFSQESCVCDVIADPCDATLYWRNAPGTSARLPVIDPDGAPVWISYGGRSWASVDGLTVSGEGQVIADVTASDGVRTVSARWDVYNTCSTTGQACGRIKNFHYPPTCP